MTKGMKCTSCEKPKAQLKSKKSKLLRGVPMYLCQECLDAKREPRGYIVLAGREAFQRGENGLDKIGFWIKPQRHCGDPITLRELT
jgi:uncharacterized protein YlaI